jgi:predicted extracellular nuclease
MTIGQLNAWNLFDTVDQPRVQDEVLTPADYELHLGKLALAIRDSMGAPDVIALQEVENELVLRDLAARPELRDFGYEPLIVEGSDPRGIDVAYLYRPSRVELLRHEQRRTTYLSPGGRNIQLFTRPPLVATFRPRAAAADAQAGAAITLVNNHFTSQLQGDDGARKRLLQAAFVASIADGTEGVELLDPQRVVVLGDLNEGVGDPAYLELVTGPSEDSPALVNAADHLPLADRYSWRDGTHRSLLDHVLMPPALDARIGAVRIPHINSDPSEREAQVPGTPLRSSDHDPVVVSLTP